MEDFNPNKRPKLSTQTLTDPHVPNRKGKEKIVEEGLPQLDEDEGASEKRTCGICLAEEGGRSIRGEIDSCDHYFCFVCVMEWSKVESRCPLCKRRFVSIRRPPVDGLFVQERIVFVPERNQVYHPLGNVTEGPEDLYSNVGCSYCQSSANEHLLLLCDLCDSAAHTYCVGLGYDVPEGDWFCSDCEISKNEHAKVEADEDCGNKEPDLHSPVSISEIIFDECPQQLRRPSKFRRFSKTESASSSLTVAMDPQGTLSHSERTGDAIITSTSLHSPTSDVAGQAARTLRRCRDVHGRIRTLRENWNELRRGSLSFKSPSAASSRTERASRELSFHSISGSKPSSSSARTPRKTQDTQATQETSNSNVSAHSTTPRDVDKAWKMLEAAKSVLSKATLLSSSHQDKKHLVKSGVLDNLQQQECLTVLEKIYPRPKVNGRITCRNDSRNIVPGIETTELKSSNDQIKIQGCNLARKLQMREEHEGVAFKETCNLAPTEKERQIVNNEVYSRANHAFIGGSTSHGPNTINHAILGSSFPESVRVEKDELSPQKRAWRHKIDAGNDDTQSSVKPSDCDAKGEVQSIVKLNMKLQRIDKCLGSEGFKKVARVATHTILAACGLKHSESLARKLPEMICKHSEHVKNIQRSKLMPDSCRECFYSFARDIVVKISSELMAEALQRS